MTIVSVAICRDWFEYFWHLFGKCVEWPLGDGCRCFLSNALFCVWFILHIFLALDYHFKCVEYTIFRRIIAKIQFLFLWKSTPLLTAQRGTHSSFAHISMFNASFYLHNEEQGDTESRIKGIFDVRFGLPSISYWKKNAILPSLFPSFVPVLGFWTHAVSIFNSVEL